PPELRRPDRRLRSGRARRRPGAGACRVRARRAPGGAGYVPVGRVADVGARVVTAAFDYSGARVLVTGGSNGIGFGVAVAFRDAGAHVMITGTRAAATDYDNDLSGLAYRQCRLPDGGAVDDVAHSLDGLDVLVNNAGQNLPGGRSEYDPDVFDEV